MTAAAESPISCTSARPARFAASRTAVRWSDGYRTGTQTTVRPTLPPAARSTAVRAARNASTSASKPSAVPPAPSRLFRLGKANPSRLARTGSQRSHDPGGPGSVSVRTGWSGAAYATRSPVLPKSTPRLTTRTARASVLEQPEQTAVVLRVGDLVHVVPFPQRAGHQCLEDPGLLVGGPAVVVEGGLNRGHHQDDLLRLPGRRAVGHPLGEEQLGGQAAAEHVGLEQVGQPPALGRVGVRGGQRLLRLVEVAPDLHRRGRVEILPVLLQELAGQQVGALQVLAPAQVAVVAVGGTGHGRGPADPGRVGTQRRGVELAGTGDGDGDREDPARVVVEADVHPGAARDLLGQLVLDDADLLVVAGHRLVPLVHRDPDQPPVDRLEGPAHRLGQRVQRVPGDDRYERVRVGTLHRRDPQRATGPLVELVLPDHRSGGQAVPAGPALGRRLGADLAARRALQALQGTGEDAGAEGHALHRVDGAAYLALSEERRHRLVHLP